MRIRALMGAGAVLAFYAVVQTAWLPADGFMAGDQGTKYLQVRGALAHGPLTPWIEGLSLDFDPDFRFQEPLLVRNGGHLVGIFPWILPALSAPFYAIAGFAGLYVIPAISVAIIFLAACSLGRQCGLSGDGVFGGVCAVFATPIVFYGAELWEHAPAIALTTIAAALICGDEGPEDLMGRPDVSAVARSAKAEGRPRRTPVPARTPVVLAGVCIGLAGAFRPEALIVLPALVLARGWVYGVGRIPRESVWLGGAAACAYALVGLGNLSVYGSFFPPHLTHNLGSAVTYLSVRRDAFTIFLLPVWHRGLFVAAAIAALANALWPSNTTTRIWLAHVLVALLLIVTIGMPAWAYFIRDARFLDGFDYRSAAQTWPFVFALAYWLRPRTSSEHVLLATSMLFIVGSLVTMPHTGGAQWSARFLLPAAPLLGVLASKRLIDPGFATPLHARLARGMCGLALACSIGVEAYGLVFLRDAKRLNADLTAKVAALTDPGAVIMSDLFWFPEVTAALYPSRRYMFAWSPDDVPAIAVRAAESGITRLNLVSSPPHTQYTPPDDLLVPGRGVFKRTELHDLKQRALYLHRYVLQPPRP